MCSRSFRPFGLPIYVARVPAAPFSVLPSSLCVDHSHCLVLAPATLAALPSTRAIPDRDVFYVAHPVRSIAECGFRIAERTLRLRVDPPPPRPSRGTTPKAFASRRRAKEGLDG